MIDPNVGKVSGRDGAGSFATLQVDIIADVVCPWSYLGKRRLDDALLAVRGPSAIHWYPFQLNPELLAAGMDFEEYLRARFGDPAAIEPVLTKLAESGKAEGIDFRFDRVSRIPNTLNAHRILRLAEAEGVDVLGVAENLFRNFFEEGVDISARDALLDIGARSGLSPRDIARTLDDDASLQIVKSREAQVRQSGVTGVPDFLINKRLLVIGAQSTASLVRVFDRVMFGEESERPVSPVVH